METVYELSADLVEKLNEITNNEEKEKIVHNYIDQILTKVKPVPDFRPNLEWFNVTSSLALQKDLGRKIVLLDFFTYCCINCLHVLPELKTLEHKYPVQDGLVVIGVHSAKFEAEKSGDSVSAAVLRHEITHPVVNDVGAIMWSQLDIACWPTLLLLAPGGAPLFIVMGEGHSQLLDQVISSSLSYFKSRDKLSLTEMPQIVPNNHLTSSSILSFPGRVALHDDMLAISDTGHHRVLIVDLTSGVVKHVIGEGDSGLVDGRFGEAKFHSPQGLAWLDETTLFVADTENHAIRQINLSSERVTTIAGTGEMDSDKEGGQDVATKQPLSSPWGIVFDPSKNVLLIAMSGSHQIWGLALKQTKWWKNRVLEAGQCVALAGSGREENRNSGYPMAAGFAQPSGLTVANQTLLVADSESSSVRAVSLTDGKVMAVVGADKNPLNLFAYGDVDGKMTEAKLQHPLDVAWCEELDFTFVVDTFNHKIKKIDASKLCSTLPCLGFGEPGGLCIDYKRKQLIVADTNNHCVKTIDLQNNYAVSKLELQFASELDFASKGDTSHWTLLTNDLITLVIIDLRVTFVSGKKPTEDAPQSWKLKLPFGWNAATLKGKLRNDDGVLSDKIEVTGNTITTPIEITLTLVTCDDTKGQCTMQNHNIIINMELSDKGSGKLNIDLKL